MQFSELLEMLYGIMAGPTGVLENCDQAQSTIGKMKGVEENIGQGRFMWKVDEYAKSVVSSLCSK